MVSDAQGEGSQSSLPDSRACSHVRLTVSTLLVDPSTRARRDDAECLVALDSAEVLTRVTLNALVQEHYRVVLHETHVVRVRINMETLA